LFHDRPDVIHTNFASLGLLAIFKKHVLKIPFIYTLHGVPQPWIEPSLVYKIAYTVEHCLLRFVASQSSVSVTISNYVKDTLKREYGIDSEVIYHGIDADKFKPKNKTESKRRLGYKKTDFIILFVGKLHPCKDPLILIKSIYEMVKINPNLRLVMAGAGELYEELRTEIHRLNLSRYVELLGFVKHEEMRLWYDAADVYVLTSVNEAFGITLLEAMASGLPVIASKVGACSEIIGNAGILFNQGDHISLARELMTLASDEELSKVLRVKGLERVRKVFSWDDKVDKYWELYRMTIQHRL
jgi:glycosyltransferase involved in cell wall biosynthesis